MTQLNSTASQIMQEVGVNACTDITGFGLLGHANRIAKSSHVGLEIYAEKVPLLKGVSELARNPFFRAPSSMNKDFIMDEVQFDEEIGEELQAILFDPQTSGGLLISVSEEHSDLLFRKLHQANVSNARVIGRVISDTKNKIYVKSNLNRRGQREGKK